jgi:hypothetical protein
MNTYRAQFMGEVPRGWDRLDTLARVVSIVSSLTIVDKTWSNMQGYTLTVGIVFQGLNDNEARETVRAASCSTCPDRTMSCWTSTGATTSASRRGRGGCILRQHMLQSSCQARLTNREEADS